jgi:hypothetical protein
MGGTISLGTAKVIGDCFGQFWRVAGDCWFLIEEERPYIATFEIVGY